MTPKPPLAKASPAAKDADTAETLAGEAFDAVADGDREGFVQAFLAAISSRAKANSPKEPDADEG